jgi:hypothetical protein
MTEQWIGTRILLGCVVAGPWCANALWQRGRSRSVGYLAGFGLMAAGLVAVVLLGGFPNALR